MGHAVSSKLLRNTSFQTVNSQSRTFEVPDVPRIWIAVFLLVIPATSADRTYLTAKLSKVFAKDLYVTANLPPLTQNSSGITLPLPLGVMYEFDLDADGITYIGSCMSKAKRSYAGEWIVNDPVPFRLAKDKLFLKRPNGKELRLGLLTRVRASESGNSSNAADSTSAAISARQNIPQCR